jgi:hypothetical protein
MSELTTQLAKVVIGIKNPFALFAFLALLLLVAFRTKAVPELFFQLLREKLTRVRFAQLTHRFLGFGFAAFLALCGISIAGQILASHAQAQPTVDAFKKELHELQVTQEERSKALAAFQQGLVLMNLKKLDDAIASVQESIRQVPTVSAKLTLAMLYDLKQQHSDARHATQEAGMLARDRGDTFGAVHAEEIERQITRHEAEADPSGNIAVSGSPLIGPHKRKFPPGGAQLEDAPVITPDTYADDIPDHVVYYKVAIKPKQKLSVVFRQQQQGVCWVHLLNVHGGEEKSDYTYGWQQMKSVTYENPDGKWAYIALSGKSSAVYAISVN